LHIKNLKNDFIVGMRIFLAMGQSKWLIPSREGAKKPPKKQNKKQKKTINRKMHTRKEAEHM